MKIPYITALILLFSAFPFVQLSAQEDWIVPEDKQSKLSPFEFNDSTVAAGKDIYNNLDKGNCVSCHGTPSQNNWQKLNPPPNDPAGTKIQSNTDGEIFYKVHEGRGLMPSFKDVLTQEELWGLISYLRSYNNTYVQEVAKKIEKTGFDGSVEIILSLLGDNTVQSKVLGTKESITEPIKGAEVNLLIKRWFGSLSLVEPVLTNAEGISTFTIPSDVPGDSLGKMTLIAQLSDRELFGDVQTEASFSVGKPTNKPSLVAKRAMWNKVRMAPLWIMITYIGGVVIAWSIIFYVVYQLKLIFSIGQKEENLNKK